MRIILALGVLFLLLVSPAAAQTPSLGGYPQIYNLWGNYNYGADNAYFSGFNLYMMYGDGSSASQQSRADAIHQLNPNTKILITADIVPAHNPGQGLDTQPQWWSAVPGTPDYACILRNSAGAILRDDTYNAAINNLTNSYCRDVLVNHFINQWQLSGGHFDGWQVDQAGEGGVSWQYGTDLDANVDGIPDDPAQVDQAFTAGLIDILTRLRTAFPHIIIHANDSPPRFGQWVNGRLYEMDLKRYLDQETSISWPEMLHEWSLWTQNHTLTPNTTGVMNSPLSSLITTKYNFTNIWNAIKPAMMAEYSADYNRMRFGLVSALMANAQYAYDLAGLMYGTNWWYDEYGTRGQAASVGYLGQPTDNKTLISQFSSPDQVYNSDFTTSLNSWYVEGSGTTPTLALENGTAHVHLPGAAAGWVVFRKNFVSVETGKYYTVSFKARANANRYGGVRVQRAGSPYEYLTNARQLRLYPDWVEYQIPLKASGTGTNGTLLFDTGVNAGDIYFDDIQFHEGVGGIWQRHFDHGTALLNESPIAQTVTLDKTYQKLQGTQAPLYFQRLDENQAVFTGSWTNAPASFDQWGLNIKTISAPNPSATATYTPNLPYAGQYEVLAWVAPNAGYSPSATVTITHAGGNTPVTLNQTTGDLGWHSLGTYSFATNGNAKAVLSATGTGTVVADAFKWVSVTRYNDNSTVNSVTLQPNDAIILLNTTAPTPSPSPAPLSGDFDLDGDVDFLDFRFLISRFTQPYTIFDFNSLVGVL